MDLISRGQAGLRRELGAAYLPVLDKAETELREALDEIPGAQLERKTFLSPRIIAT